jgi:hypothetical protein
LANGYTMHYSLQRNGKDPEASEFEHPTHLAIRQELHRGSLVEQVPLGVEHSRLGWRGNTGSLRWGIPSPRRTVPTLAQRWRLLIMCPGDRYGSRRSKLRSNLLIEQAIMRLYSQNPGHSSADDEDVFRLNVPDDLRLVTSQGKRICKLKIRRQKMLTRKSSGSDYKRIEVADASWYAL